MKLPDPPKDDLLPAFCTCVLVVIVALFAVRNLPWHLDDLDQAKQAYTSFQIAHDGSWFFQQTPDGAIATKPPFAAWISTLLYFMAGGHGWEYAWRLPSFVCALLVLRTLWRSGEALFGSNIGALLAAGAFGLNAFTPRLATLVRTDMLLTACIFFVGWLVLEKVRDREPWTRGEQWTTCGLILAALMTKGPIAYGFLLPGMILYWFLARRRGMEQDVWAGVWPWLLPVVIFGAWVACGIATNLDFYHEVVEKEFLGRWTFGAKAEHHNFLPGWYSLKLLTQAMPWSLLLAAVWSVREVRAAMRENPALLWLACWTFGGLVFMECVPSKRFDRIFPVVPPACLLLAAAARYLPGCEWRRQPIGRLAIVCAVLGVPIAGGYAGWRIAESVKTDARALVRFGEVVQETVQDQHDRLAVVNARDEGLLLYIDQERFVSLEDALALWKSGRIEWIVIGEDYFSKVRRKLEPYEELASTPTTPEKAGAYRFLKRVPRPVNVDPSPVPAGAVQHPVPPLPPHPAPGTPAWEAPAKL